MEFDPSSLLRLSAPGYNRAIGAYDVIPYLGQTNPNGMSDVGEAIPGVTSALPGQGSPIGNSALNNLSALTPILNAIIAQQQAAAIPSGQAQAFAQPLPSATPGTSTVQLAPQIAAAAPGAVPIAGSVVDSTPSGAAAGDSGAGVGTSGSGDSGAVGDGTAGGIGGTAAGGEGGGGVGASGSGDSSGVGDGTAGGIGGDAAGGEGGPGTAGDSGDGGAGGGGGGGGGASILVTYTLGHLPTGRRRAVAFWTRVRRETLSQPNGLSAYAYYQRTGARIIKAIDALPASERNALRAALHRALVAPFQRRARTSDVAPAVQHLFNVCRSLDAMLGANVLAEAA